MGMKSERTLKIHDTNAHIHVEVHPTRLSEWVLGAEVRLHPIVCILPIEKSC